jgi:hypothetical protein
LLLLCSWWTIATLLSFPWCCSNFISGLDIWTF